MTRQSDVYTTEAARREREKLTQDLALSQAEVRRLKDTYEPGSVSTPAPSSPSKHWVVACLLLLTAIAIVVALVLDEGARIHRNGF